jgi:hypothetical protein
MQKGQLNANKTKEVAIEKESLQDKAKRHDLAYI